MGFLVVFKYVVHSHEVGRLERHYLRVRFVIHVCRSFALTGVGGPVLVEGKKEIRENVLIFDYM